MIPAGTGPCASRLAIPRALGHFAPARLILGVAIGVLLLACGPGGPVVTPPISPGSAARPREVNIIAKDYSYLPSVVDLVPGETVLLHLVNGGLDAHEVVVGDAAVQAAWESAELAAAAVGGPPGATPAISLPPGLQGLRVVIRSGERVDLTWTVPSPPAAAASSTPLIVGCHIPGHWAKGMQVPVRFVSPAGLVIPAGA